MKKPNTFANLTQSLIRYLNCPCQSFEPMEDDDPIQNAYRQARDRGGGVLFRPAAAQPGRELFIQGQRGLPVLRNDFSGGLLGQRGKCLSLIHI